MVQDIAPHLFENGFSHRPITKTDYVLCFGEGGLLLSQKQELALPTLGQLQEELELPDANFLFLFTQDGATGFYLLQTQAPEKLSGFSYVPTNTLRSRKPHNALFACAVGESLFRWYQQNQFCGQCASSMEKSPIERAMVCPTCGQTVYPKICPAVIVAICHGDKLLLSRYANRPNSRLALIAGFAEIGESIENTVRREVMEEVGLEIENLQFYKSQPWVFTDSLLMGFFAQLKGSNEVRLQEEELSMADWFHREGLPEDSLGISLTAEMIELFKRGKDPFSFSEKLV